VRKVAGTTVDYVYDHAGHELAEVGTSGAWTREEVYVGGRHLATYSGTTTYFHNADWLGTERVRTDVNGDIYETCQGLPYGDGQACVGGEITPMHLTGKHRDTETNLDDFPARYYSSTQGRWLSPDPLMNSGEPTNPQTWNRYTYAENDPIGAFDPDGLFDWKGPACMAKQCEQYRKTLTDAVRTLKEKADKMKDSPEKRRLESALKAFGTAGDHNGVYVSFGPTRHGAAGETEPVFNAQTGRVDYNVTLDPHKMSGENEYAVNSAHEGTHVDDFSNPLYNDHATSLSAFAFEYRGYQTSVFAASALGASSLSAKYDGKNYELWNGSWAQVDRNLTNFISKFHDEGGNQNHPETTPHNPWPN
jgi:RHS repeat-associated protein